MKNVYRFTVLGALLGACGGTSNAASTTPNTPPSAAQEAPPEEAPPLAFPIPSARFVAQTLPEWSHPIMQPLPGGRVAFIASGVFAVTDAELHIVQRTRIPTFDPDDVVLADAAAGHLVLQRGYVSLASGTARESPEDRVYVACEGVTRCVTIEPSETTWLRVRVEDASTGTEADAFDVGVDVVGQPAALRPQLTLDEGSGALVGSHLAVSARTVHGTTFLFTYDLTAHAGVASVRRDRSIDALHWADANGEQLYVFESGAAFLLDARTAQMPQRARAMGRILSTYGSDLTLHYGNAVRTYERATLTPVGDESGTIVVYGDNGRALASSEQVRFLGTDGTVRGEVSVDLSSFGAERGRFALDGDTFYAWHANEGLVRVRLGETTVSRAPLVHERRYVELDPHDDHFVLEPRSAFVNIGPEGIVARARTEPEPEHAAEDPELARQRALRERARQLFPDEDVFAIAREGRQGAVYAYLAGGKVHVTDGEGTEVARPVRVPANVARSECYNLAFITDVDLALSGSAPCIPTRINFRTGRTSPLGRAYVAIHSTPDGARVAMMADRRIHILDGRTGATLHEVDPELDHPRSIQIARDGQHAILFGEGGLVVIDLRSLGTAGTTPELLRFDNAYVTQDNARLLVCEGATLKVVKPFDEAGSQTIPFAPCAGDVRFSAIDGMYVARTGPSVFHLVRARDGAMLELDVVETFAGFAILVQQGDQVLGVAPADTTLVRVRNEAGTASSPVPSSTSASDVVRAFFAADG